MKNTVFHFQHFSVRQRDSAMKVGTDGVLLGAWANIESEAQQLLDVGTGTGLIALMLAQRFPQIHLDAIEIDPNAAGEAQYNFSKSLWANRFELYLNSFADFFSNPPKKYDHLVCNPPFYTDGYPIENKSRDCARSNKNLSYKILFEGVSILLTARGKFSLIVPVASSTIVAELAQLHGLFLQRETKVRGNKAAPYKRLLLEYTRVKCKPTKTCLTLETQRNIRTPEHQQLVDTFYLPKA